MGAHRHQHGIKALRQKRLGFGDALATAQLNARLGIVTLGDLQNRRDLGVNRGVGQTICRNTVAHLAADLLIGLEHHNLVALLSAIERGGQTSGAGAHNGNHLAAQRLMAHVGLPVACIAHGSGALKATDRNRRAVELVALTGILAVVHANVTQALGERNLLAHHRGGAGVLAVADVTQVARNIHVSGAARATGSHVIGIRLVLIEHIERVDDRARRAHLDAGPAKTTTRLLQAHAAVGANANAVLGTLVVQDTGAAQLAAGAHAAAAANAAGEHVGDQRVRFVRGDRTALGAPARRRNSQVLIHRLQLALAVLGTAGAIGGMRGQDQFHRQLAHALGLLTRRVYDHSLGNRRLAGAHRLVLAINLDHAQAASTHGLKVGVLTQMRDVNTGVERGLQDILPLSCLDLGSINR